MCGASGRKEFAHLATTLPLLCVAELLRHELAHALILDSRDLKTQMIP